jgi:hypothetical protein
VNLAGLEEIAVEVFEREVRYASAIDHLSDIDTTVSQQGQCLARIRD